MFFVPDLLCLTGIDFESVYFLFFVVPYAFSPLQFQQNKSRQLSSSFADHGRRGKFFDGQKELQVMCVLNCMRRALVRVVGLKVAHLVKALEGVLRSYDSAKARLVVAVKNEDRQ